MGPGVEPGPPAYQAGVLATYTTPTTCCTANTLFARPVWGLDLPKRVNSFPPWLCRLVVDTGWYSQHWRFYQTPEAAIEALSDALLLLAKRQPAPA